MALLIPTRAIVDTNANYPLGYHRGNVGGLPAVEPDLIAANIKWGVIVFGILGTMLQWIYDLSFPELAKLIIPEPPTLSLVVAEDHSGGGFTTTSNLVVPAPPALAISELALFDQRYETGDDGDFSIGGVYWEGQTFIVNVAHPIGIVEIKCRLVGDPATVGNITIGIRATAADLPTGPDLTSVTFPASDLPVSDFWITKYVTAYALSSGVKYAKVIRTSGGDGSNYMVWRKDGTVPTYTDGARVFSIDGGASWSEDPNTDFMFREGEVL